MPSGENSTCKYTSASDSKLMQIITKNGNRKKQANSNAPK